MNLQHQVQYNPIKAVNCKTDLVLPALSNFIYHFPQEIFTFEIQIASLISAFNSTESASGW